MRRTSHHLPARYYAQLCTRLAELGTDVPALLRDAGIDADVLWSVDGRLTPEQVERLVPLAMRHSGRSDLGFELGRLTKLSSHDILGYAMLSAPTLDHALRLVARYFRLITPAYTVEYRCDSQRAEVIYRPALPLSTQVLAFHFETLAVGCYETIRALLLHAPPTSIHLPIDPPPHAERYRELKAATVHFDRDTIAGVRVVLDREVVGLPLAMADQTALRMAERRCATLLATVVERSSLGDWVQMMLREASDGQPTLQELARILNLSARTLERRLAREGHGFRDIERHVRHERACELLRAGGLSVTRIAYELGYSDTANFTRAFRREAGITPSAYRDRHAS